MSHLTQHDISLLRDQGVTDFEFELIDLVSFHGDDKRKDFETEYIVNCACVLFDQQKPEAALKLLKEHQVPDHIAIRIQNPDRRRMV